MIKITLKNQGTINKNNIYLEKEGRKLELNFSYETIVGYSFNHQIEEIPMDATAENQWSNTTGKFLNELCPNKKLRIPHSKLLEYLEIILKQF